MQKMEMVASSVDVSALALSTNFAIRFLGKPWSTNHTMFSQMLVFLRLLSTLADATTFNAQSLLMGL